MIHKTTCAGLVTLLLGAGCGGDGAAPPGGSSAPAAPVASAAASGKVTPCPTCKVIEVRMITRGEGNFFEPQEIEAHEGDVLRFKLEIGVHNANFLPDSNPGRKNLPPATPLLQLPGQTWDILLNFGTGDFYFQCDPHAPLGMKGKVEVEERESGAQ